MPINLPNFLQAETSNYGVPSDLLEQAFKGNKMLKEAKQLQQEERQRDLAARLTQAKTTYADLRNQYYPRQTEANISNVNAQTGLYGEQTRGHEIANKFEKTYGGRAREANIQSVEQSTEATRIQNRIESLYGERAKLANINSVEALTRKQELDNEIEEAVGEIKALLGIQKSFHENTALEQQNQARPIQNAIEALKGVGELDAQDLTNSLNQDYSETQRKQEQQTRALDIQSKEHALKLSKDYDDTLAQLRIAKETGDITGQEYDNATKKVNSIYQDAIKQLEVGQGRANIAHTNAGTESLQQGTIGQQIKNDVEKDYARRREELAQKLLDGQISGVDYDNENKAINNQYQEDIKKNEVSQGKANVAATNAATKNTVAATQALDFKNRLNGKYGEKDRKLAQDQAQKSIDLLSTQGASAWDDLQRKIKFGDQAAAADLQNKYDQSALQRAKVLKEVAEANRHEKAYKNIPEGSVPISELQRGAQTAVLKEQAEMKKRIDGAEKALRDLDEMEKILKRNPDFSDDWKIALTVSDKQGVIQSLAKVIVPGQNKRQREDAERFVKLSQDLVLEHGAAALGGQFTNAKYRGMQAAKPYVGNSKKSNLSIIQHMKREFEPLKKFKKDFQKAHYKYTIDFDWAKYADIPLDQLSDDELRTLHLAKGLE